MPDASAQTEGGSTRKPLAEKTIAKYEKDIQRLQTADLTLTDAESVLDWFKNRNKLGDSAIKVYLSALKWFLIKEGHAFPKAYQNELNRIYGKQIDMESDQLLTEKQLEKYVPYSQLLKVTEDYAKIPDKTNLQWEQFVTSALYTLNAPVRADYGTMRIYGRKDERRDGNELIWSSKPYFIFKQYKTRDTYGTVEIPVSKELYAVLDGWFKHLGEVPKFLFGKSVDNAVFATQVANAFGKTGKFVGINLLRHAYIQHHLPPIATNTKKREELAKRMLHSVERQQAYYSQNV